MNAETVKRFFTFSVILHRFSTAVYYDPYPSSIHVPLCTNQPAILVISCQTRLDETAGWLEIIDGETRILNGRTEVNLTTGGIVSMSSNKGYSQSERIFYLHLNRLSMRDNGATISCYKTEEDPSYIPKKPHYTSTINVIDCESTKTTTTAASQTSRRESMSPSIKSNPPITITTSNSMFDTSSREAVSTNSKIPTRSDAETDYQQQERSRIFTTVIPVVVVITAVTIIVALVVLLIREKSRNRILVEDLNRLKRANYV